jgi:hypothetical protein
MNQRIYHEAYATLSFLDENLDPLEVTKLLGLPPDEVHRHGEPRLRRSKSGEVEELHPPWPHGFWAMSSENWVDSSRVQSHIRWILEQLEPKAEHVARISERVEQSRIFCYSLGKSDQPPSYPAELDQRAGALGLYIDIDHYDSR